MKQTHCIAVLWTLLVAVWIILIFMQVQVTYLGGLGLLLMIASLFFLWFYQIKKNAFEESEKRRELEAEKKILKDRESKLSDHELKKEMMELENRIKIELKKVEKEIEIELIKARG